MKYSIILPSFFNAAFNLLHLLQEEEEEEEEEAGLELKMTEESASGRERCGGPLLVSVGSNLSSRSLFLSGICGFLTVDAVERTGARSDFLVCVCGGCV